MKLFNGNNFLETILLGNCLKLYAGKFFETICWKFFGNYILGYFWNSYDGNLLMENSGGYQRLFEGGNYGTILQYHTTVSRQWDLERQLSIPTAQTFLEQCEGKRAKSNDGDAQPMLGTSEVTAGKHNSGEVNRKALA